MNIRTLKIINLNRNTNGILIVVNHSIEEIKLKI